MKQALLWITLVLCAPVGSAWDDDLAHQIEAMEHRIQMEPWRADLFAQRADLLRRYGRLEDALDDVRQAKSMYPPAENAGLIYARTIRDADHPYRALVAYSRFLKIHPENNIAAREQAQLLALLGHSLHAVRIYDPLISEQPQPAPELLIARHRALLNAGRPQQAIQSLTQGIERLGPLVSLVLPALEIELQLGRFDSALARIEDLRLRIPRLDAWHLQRARVLHQAGRKSEAREAYQAALTKLTTLPRKRRMTPMAQDMIQSALDGLDDASHRSSR